MGAALSTPQLDGIVTDCSCGPPPGVTPGPLYTEFAQAALDWAVATGAAEGKWVTSWFPNAALPEPPNVTSPYDPAACGAAMHAMIAQGQLNAAMEFNFDGWLHGYTTVLPWLAAFMVVRGPYAYLTYVSTPRAFIPQCAT